MKIATRTPGHQEILMFSHEDTRKDTKKQNKIKIIRGNSCNSWAIFIRLWARCVS